MPRTISSPGGAAPVGASPVGATHGQRRRKTSMRKGKRGRGSRKGRQDCHKTGPQGLQSALRGRILTSWLRTGNKSKENRPILAATQPSASQPAPHHTSHQPRTKSPTGGARHEVGETTGGAWEREWEWRGVASYSRAYIGAFLPDTKSGSGAGDHDLGGGGFARGRLTPLERVVY